MLPELPSEKTRFWTYDEEILCKTQAEADIVASFLEDALRGSGDVTTVFKTGYYDPFEDARDGVVDDSTGYCYISCE